MKRIRYEIKGMSCAACVSHVERAVGKILDRESISVSLLTNSLTVTIEETADEKKLYSTLKKVLSDVGYGLFEESDNASESKEKEKNSDLSKWVVSALITLTLMYIAMGSMFGLPVPAFLTRNGVVFGSVQMVLALCVVILQFRFYRNGFSALFHRAPNMDSLIAIGSGASMVYGFVAIGWMAYGYAANQMEWVHSYYHNLYFESAAMILCLVSLGKILEKRAKTGATKAIRQLAAMMPKSALRERNGELEEIPLSAVEVGDILVVREGETIPVDGILTEGYGYVDESSVSGESLPVEKKQGDLVLTVCVLQSGSFKMRAEKVGKDTSLSRIIGLLEDAAASKAPIARLADKISGIFVPAVIAISLITAILWMVFTGDFVLAFSSSISVLVISCPCALGLATPTAVMVGISRGASKGILIKNSEALEHLRSIRYFMTDKTGTLTEGKPKVTDLSTEKGISENQLLSFAYGAESRSTHPLATAICEKAKERSLSLPSVQQYRSVIGQGILAEVNGAECVVGKPSFLKERGIEGDFDTWEKQAKDWESQGRTAIWVAYDGRFCGLIGISDPIRSDSVNAVQILKQMGITPVMVTGDNPSTAKAIAGAAQIDESHVYASLLPEDKERILREHSQRGRTAMVGDGINDAPALSSADIGIAIGAGTEIAIDCADVVLSKNSLMDAVYAIDLSRATLRCIKQNLFWALIYNSICIPIAAGALYPLFGIALSPMIGSATMSISSLCVVLNSLRLYSIPLIGDEKKNKKTIQRIKNTNHMKKEKEDMFGKTKTVSFCVEGMMCNHCKANVEKAILSIKGVKSCEADVETKKVTAIVKESLSEDLLKAAVVSAGYHVS